LLEYAPGEEIMPEGEWGGNTFYIVVAGRAEVYTGAPNRQSKIAEIPPGMQFGVADLLAAAPHNAAVRAPRDQWVRVLEIRRPALRLLKKPPNFGEKLSAEYRERIRAGSEN
jgi:CRP-like cAMP-binding protein